MQEIHDNIGQVLSLAKLNLGTIDLNNPNTLTQKIEDSRELVGKAIQDLRSLAKGLNTSFLTDMGLLRSIEYELDMVRKSGVFIIKLNTLGHQLKSISFCSALFRKCLNIITPRKLPNS